jgi:hypothetical protein
MPHECSRQCTAHAFAIGSDRRRCDTLVCSLERGEERGVILWSALTKILHDSFHG